MEVESTERGDWSQRWLFLGNVEASHSGNSLKYMKVALAESPTNGDMEPELPCFVSISGLTALLLIKLHIKPWCKANAQWPSVIVAID